LNKPPTRRGKEPPDEEAKLDRGIRALLGKGPEDYQPDQWRGLREQFRLNVLYPGQYVAYRDHYEGEGDQRRLVRREVLCAYRTLPGLHKRLAQLPEESQRGARVGYVEADKAIDRGR
jgi:hypothetical protein